VTLGVVKHLQGGGIDALATNWAHLMAHTAFNFMDSTLRNQSKELHLKSNFYL
jgi:hypothetical protein